MTIFVLFFVELMAMRYATFGHNHDDGKEPETTMTASKYIAAPHPTLNDTLPEKTI